MEVGEAAKVEGGMARAEAMVAKRIQTKTKQKPTYLGKQIHLMWRNTHLLWEKDLPKAGKEPP